NFTVNTAAPGAEGEARDVAWGPKPQLLRWKPLGNNQAAEVTWTVEVAVPECFAPPVGTVRPMEAVYRVQWSVDAGGYQRRTVTGYLLIPMTRHNPGDPSLTDSADSFREQINPEPVPGFRRIPGEFSLSDDKRRLDYAIVDEQMPENVPPAGFVDAEASHRVNWQMGNKGAATATLSASYEPARETPKTRAWEEFRKLLQDRIAELKGKAAAIPLSFTFAEPELYGRRTAEFSVTYQTTKYLDEILPVSGL